MDVILHLGAHRTGSTTFQTYLRGVDTKLVGQGIGFWGPWRTRKGLFHGLMEPSLGPAVTRRAQGRVRLAAEASARRGLASLLVSDENMLGSPRASLRARSLYPDAGKRLAMLRPGFPSITRAVLQIRSPEVWWASMLGYMITRGGRLPDAALLEALVASPRGWREVICDIATALPQTGLMVTPFERFAARPDRLLQRAAGAVFTPPMPRAGIWAHRGPDLGALRALLTARGEDPALLPEGEGRWMPFSPAQAATLRERYADDLFWLRAGADGLATLTEDPEPETDRLNWPPAPTTRGHDDDGQNRRLAQTR